MLTPTRGAGSRKPSALYPQINARIAPEVHSALLHHLSDPLLTKTPSGALATFIEVAIKNELTRRGVALCQPSPSTKLSSSPTSEPDPTAPPMPPTLDFF